MTSERTELRQARHVFALLLDDEALLWDDRREQLHRLNPSATLVWDGFAHWSTVQTVNRGSAVSSRLDANGVADCVDELRALGLLEWRTTSSDQAGSGGSAETTDGT